MSKSRKLKRNAKLRAATKSQQRLPWIATAALIVGVVVASVYWWRKGEHEDAPPTVVATAETQAMNPTLAVSSPALGKLKGRWLRPDGGYVLEVKDVDGASGKLDVAYLNPRSIHVSKAEASRDGDNLKVFVELRDVRYPGSTYTLAYDPPTDQLKGIYYQAALGQQFEVYFERIQ
jgi:hypothetical protein